MAEMWSKAWLWAGLSCQLPKANDYLTYTVGDNSVVITRGTDGVARAFHNVCRHRGSRICREEQGSSAALVCPYHQWTYSPTTGALKHARDMGEGFDARQHGLKEAFCRELHGMLWVSLGERGGRGAPHFDFEEAAAVMGGQLRYQGLERVKVALKQRYVVNANWKLVYENNRECYHCNKGHPEYIKANYDTAFSYQRGEGRAPDAGHPQSAEAQDQIARMSAKWGAQLPGVSCTADSTFPGKGWYRATRNPMRKGWVVESLDGQRVCTRLLGDLPDEDMGSLRVHTFPNHWTHASSDHAVMTRLTPLGRETTEALVLWVVDEGAEEGRDYDLQRMTPFWRLTSEQDWRLCEDNQRGVMSPAYSPGPLSPLKEESVEKFIRWYLTTMQDMIQHH